MYHPASRRDSGQGPRGSGLSLELRGKGPQGFRMNPENVGELWGSGDSGTRTDLCQILKQRLIVIAVIAAPTSTHQHQPFGQPKVGRMSLMLGGARRRHRFFERYMP